MSETAAPPTLPTGRDFPDRLPAMVVKELRQGLRARLFAETVAGFHLVIVVLILPVVSFASPNETGGIQRLVWGIFAAVLVLLLPLRGLSALSQERRANTLDTLLLTNLRAGRIVRGKWLAIAAQIVLVGLSLMPYILILYAGGGVSLPGSLLTLLRLMLAGLVLTAVYVALSWNDSWLWRAAPGVALAFLAMKEYAGPLVAELQNPARSFAAWSGPWRVPAEGIAGTVLIYLFLEATAQRLAPSAENHHTLPRLVALALPWAALLVPDPLMMQAALAGLTMVSFAALMEPWPVEPPVERTWHRWAALASGWPHGVLWAVAAWGSAAWVVQDRAPELEEMTLRLAAWLFCGRLVLFLAPATWGRHGGMLLLTALMLVLGQALLALMGSLLEAPALTAAAAALPSPLPAFGVTASQPALPWIAAGAALLCAAAAGMALSRHRSLRKELPL